MLSPLNWPRLRSVVALLVIILPIAVGLLSSWPTYAQTPPEVASPEESRPEASSDGVDAVRNLTLSSDEPGSLTISWDTPQRYTQTYDIKWIDYAGYGPQGGRHACIDSPEKLHIPCVKGGAMKDHRGGDKLYHLAHC